MSDVLIQACLLLLSLLAGVMMITYALSLARRHSARASTAHRRRSITVLVCIKTMPEPARLELWVQEIVRLTVKNVDIVIVDDTGTSKLKSHILQLLARKNVKLPLYYYRPRKQATLQMLLKHGYNRSRQGDVVLVVGLEHRLTNRVVGAIRTGLRINIDRRKVAYMLSETTQGSSVLLGFAQVCRERLRDASYEICSILGAQLHQARIRPVVFSRYMLRSTSMDSHMRFEYVADIRLATAPRRAPQLISASRVSLLAVSALFLYAMAYALSLAVTRQAVQPFLLLWLLVSVVLFLIIHTSYSLTVRQKLLYTYSLPVGVYLIAADGMIQTIDTFRQLGRAGIAYILRFM